MSRGSDVTRAAPILTALVLWSLSLDALALSVPELTGRVNDYADLISPAAEARIDERLKRLEEDSGAQVVVLTIASLQGEPLEEYSLRVAETWKLGRRWYCFQLSDLHHLANHCLILHSRPMWPF